MSKTPEKISFTGAQGDELAARLDFPDGLPRAYVLFAHCFTCSKDVFAASRIAGELAGHGFAVLRFDFTGLGASEGEFANTNFSSNVEDLLKAADYLRQNHEAPSILVGHSLGGAAVLAAASQIPEARAVATIGAPADAAHVIENFAAQLNEIESEGVAQVELAGRSFTIKKQFLDDLRSHSLAERIGSMQRALIVFHSPRDMVVGIENAAEIFMAAKHPKSFISLDDADHLLTRREDAAYVAQVLSAWASRYIPEAEGEHLLTYPGPKGVVSSAGTGVGRFQQEVVSERHRLLADEPESYGGLDTGPSPYDLLSMALGTCTSMTIRLYADRKGVPLEQVKVHVRHGKVHADDCEDCGEGREGAIDRFERELEFEGMMDEKQRRMLTKIADRCPVHKTLAKSSVIVTRLKESELA